MFSLFQATITRSAQPMVGLGGKRSREDERYVHLILEANPHAHKLLIFDARPHINARANQVRTMIGAIDGTSCVCMKKLGRR